MLAIIRKDLFIEGIGVPVGDTYYFGEQALDFRWLNEQFDRVDNEDKFQVFFNENWRDALSIDWDFVEGNKL